MKDQRNPIPTFHRYRKRYRKPTKIRTTVFELVEILHEVVDKGEEELIPQIVLHMVRSGQLKVLGGPRAFRENHTHKGSLR